MYAGILNREPTQIWPITTDTDSNAKITFCEIVCNMVSATLNRNRCDGKEMLERFVDGLAN